MKRKQEVMTNDTFNNVLKQVKYLNIKSVYCHQIGEPLCDPKIVERINMISQYIIKTSISTNAMLLTSQKAGALFNSSLSELTLALDSLDKKVYNKLRVGGDFDRVKTNIDNCLKLRTIIGAKSNCKVELQVIVTKDNVNEIPNFKSAYGWLDNTTWGKLRIKEFSTFAGNVEDISPNGITPRRFSCPKLFNSIGVQCNGDIVFCCRCFDSDYVLGNINTDNLNTVFNSDKFNLLRTKMQNKDFTDELSFCKNC
jgi:radical SAM protein with 4Fe4S-binding SPASM domain